MWATAAFAWEGPLQGAGPTPACAGKVRGHLGSGRGNATPGTRKAGLLHAREGGGSHLANSGITGQHPSPAPGKEHRLRLSNLEVTETHAPTQTGLKQKPGRSLENPRVFENINSYHPWVKRPQTFCFLFVLCFPLGCKTQH